jgi:hypothetical protein
MVLFVISPINPSLSSTKHAILHVISNSFDFDAINYGKPSPSPNPIATCIRYNFNNRNHLWTPLAISFKSKIIRRIIDLRIRFQLRQCTHKEMDFNQVSERSSKGRSDRIRHEYSRVVCVVVDVFGYLEPGGTWWDLLVGWLCGG